MSNRRGFLKLLGMAPVAGPVAAKEAAASMGLEGAIGGISMVGGMAPASPSGLGPADWIQEQIREHLSGEANEGYQRMAEERARRLDADLASFRSVSPAWAYRKQIDREYQREVGRQESWLRRSARKHGLGRLFTMGT
jgi:hypothetical protein